MRRFRLALLAGALGLFATALPARAQEDVAEADAPEDFMGRMVTWVKATKDFCGDVRLEEADIRKIIELQPSLDKLGAGEDEDEEDEWIEEAYKDGRFDYDVLLRNEKYQKWAREHSVDARMHMRKSMRLVMLQMRDGIDNELKEAEKRLPEQLKQLEAARGQMDEETYQATKSMMESSLASMRRICEACREFPAATESETALLTKYAKEIEKVMDDSSEDDEDQGWDDEDEEEIEEEEE